MSDYTLEQINTSPENLILDPRNPRIIPSPSNYLCGENEDFSKISVQQNVLQFLNQPKYKIKNLENSILKNGFLDIDSIFVKKYKSGKYLVLEGNRRTAAITNLRLKSTTPSEIQASIKTVPVKLIKFSKGADEDKVIAQLLSIRHLDGPLEWEPMQQAFTVFSHYNKYFIKIYGKEDFFYDTKIRAELEGDLGLAPKDIIKKLGIVRIFQQLKEYNYTASSNHYSIIDRLISYPKLATGCFGYDYKTLSLSEDGIDKFANLCIEADRPISDPKKVRNLYNYFTNGRSDIVYLLSEGSITLKEADEMYKIKGNATRFINTLQKALKELEKLNPTDYTGTGEEIKLIKKIRLIAGKLNKL